MTKSGYRSVSTRMKDALRPMSFIVNLKRALVPNSDGMLGITKLNLLRTFPLFRPYSAGTYKDRSRLTVQAINQVFPFLAELAHTVGHKPLPIQPITSVVKTESQRSSVASLKSLFDKHGSDKADQLDYHYLYAPILEDSANIRRIFEIGMGTNNTDVVSNMGHEGSPGASLRAFRDFCPEAIIHGADVDKRILFQEDRIKTHFIDQTDPATFERLLTELPRDFDLFIDDGLHSPNANIASLDFGLKLVKVGGWAVVEDIGSSAIPLWQSVAAMMPESHRPYLFVAKSGSIVFAVQRLH